MAKTKKPIEVIEKDEDLDDLLGSSEEGEYQGEDDDEDLLGEESLMEKAEKGTLDKVEKKVTKSKEDKEKEKEEAKKKKAAEKAAAPPKELKGVKVEFLNKAGEKITGNGVLYYVVRMNGKLHYKEASQVTLLP